MRAHTITPQARAGARGRMKRRIVPGGILALSLAVVLLAAAASTASAATEYHVQLFEKQSFQGWKFKAGDVFRYKGKMFDPQNRDNRVGSDRGKCKFTGSRRNPSDTVLCEGTIHLNGELGGSGDIEYGGTLRHGDDTFDVVGGSGDFAGATGETGFRNLVKRGRPAERFWPRLMTTWDLVVP
jgi:hypothetical protein